MGKSNARWSRQDRFQLAGWALFLLCALLFVASGIKNRDLLTFIGSLVFLVACVVFLVPLLLPEKPANPPHENVNSDEAP